MLLQARRSATVRVRWAIAAACAATSVVGFLAPRWLPGRDPGRLTGDRGRALLQGAQLARQAVLHLTDGMEHGPLVASRASGGVNGPTVRAKRFAPIRHQALPPQPPVLRQPPDQGPALGIGWQGTLRGPHRPTVAIDHPQADPPPLVGRDFVQGQGARAGRRVGRHPGHGARLGLLDDRGNGADTDRLAGHAAQADLDGGIATMALDQQGHDRRAGGVGKGLLQCGPSLGFPGREGLARDLHLPAQGATKAIGMLVRKHRGGPWYPLVGCARMYLTYTVFPALM